jgi:hypothetical protein
LRAGCRSGAYFAPQAGDPASAVPIWAPSPASVSDRLTISLETFDRLRWAAKWALGAAARPTPLPAAKRTLLDRIINNGDAIKEMFRRFDAGFNKQFLGKTRAGLVGLAIAPATYAIPTDDLILLHKMWNIGLEEIVAQTVVHVTGDVTTRVQEAVCHAGSEAVFSIHRQSIDVSVASGKSLLDAVREIAGTAVGALLGGRR